MVMTCPRHKRPCFAIECNGIKSCWLDQLEQEKHTGDDNVGRLCSDLGIYCYLPECNAKGECMTQAKKAVDAVLGPIGSDKADASKTGKWICPTDQAPCEMISCNGGQSCYVERQRNYTAGASPTTFVPQKPTPPCHEGMHQLGWINRAELMIGRESSAKAWDQAEHGKIGLIIGLLGDPYPQGNLVGMNEAGKSMASNLLVVTPPIPNIWIRWPDYGIVPFGRAWWENLLSIIAGVDGAVLLYCMGGHGRSGTAAAILCTLAGLVPEGQDPVQWVRHKYCHKVVEADCQLDYIEKITGRKVLAAAAKESYTNWTSYTGQGGGTTHYSTKKAHGGGVGSAATKVDAKELSKRKWKTWWRHVSQATKESLYAAVKDITRLNDMPDGQTFVVGKKHWRWSLTKGELEDVTPKE